MISSNEETPVPPDWNRGSQVNHEAKQREGWSLPNKSLKVQGCSYFLIFSKTKSEGKILQPVLLRNGGNIRIRVMSVNGLSCHGRTIQLCPNLAHQILKNVPKSSLIQRVFNIFPKIGYRVFHDPIPLQKMVARNTVLPEEKLYSTNLSVIDKESSAQHDPMLAPK